MAQIPVTPQLNTLVSAITTQENAPAYLNNPCALVFAHQPGASPSGLPNQLAQFDSAADGETACQNQIGLYAAGTCGACGGNPLTLDQMTAIYCPASVPGCDPTTYANNLANALGISSDTLVADAITGSGVPSGDQSVPTDSGIFSGLSQTVNVVGAELPMWAVAGAALAALGAVWLAMRG